MRVHHTICCGIDVHKKSVTACLMWGPADQEPQFEIRRFETMTSELKALAEWLKQARCEVAAMESTGAYWKPVWNVLESEIRLILAKAKHGRALSGEKTDRLLENREIYPLGGRKMIRTDARFIAATNQDLETLVMAGKFRQDLFFRFNVARIHLPSVAERKEDIPDLLQFFLNQYGEGTGHCVDGFTPELMKCLLHYDWPGNVREIRNLVEAIFQAVSRLTT